ncbi:MAG TPA: ribonuclease III [Vicinamibacterales bacterium]
MSDPVVVFRTRSDVEASVVRGLLETHGIPSMVSAEAIRSIFPAPAGAHGDVRISVPAELAEEAVRLIESYRQGNEPGPRVVRLRDEFAGLEARLGYRFRDRGLLEHALTHRSRANEDVTGGVVDNESLEFLGDAVLGLLIAEALYHEHPQLDEGEKSKIKASLVSTTSLARVAEELGLGEHLLLGRGEEKTGGRRKPALLADACEALIAAVYLDGGLEAARELVRRELWERASIGDARGAEAGSTGDYKSALQEALQAAARGLPEYRIVAERGPDHDKVFEVEVRVGGEVVATATGRTKKEAEQAAARHALETLSGT